MLVSCEINNNSSTCKYIFVTNKVLAPNGLRDIKGLLFETDFRVNQIFSFGIAKFVSISSCKILKYPLLFLRSASIYFYLLKLLP